MLKYLGMKCHVDYKYFKIHQPEKKKSIHQIIAKCSQLVELSDVYMGVHYMILLYCMFEII